MEVRDVTARVETDLASGCYRKWQDSELLNTARGAHIESRRTQQEGIRAVNSSRAD